MLKFISGCFGERCDHLGLESHFKVLKKVGYGVEGEVFLCEEKATGDLVAIKTVPRGLQPAHQRMLTNEAVIHYQLAASNAAVVPIRELVLTHKCLGFVMEYMSGGTLQSFVEAQKRLDEDMAAYLFRQVLMAVEKCHVHRVAYRDLKPDNCLLTADSPPRLKLCDFGVSKQWSKDTSSRMATIAGTPGYLCPEMLGKLLYGGSEYDAVKSDVWAMGALLSHMLLGHSPFYFEEVAEFTGMKGALQFAYEVEVNSTWRHEAASRSDKFAKLDMSMISESAKQLLDILLDKNPEVRPSIADIQTHPWVSRPLPAKYQTALDCMAREQARLESRLSPIPDDLPEQVQQLVTKACDKSTLKELSIERISMQPASKAACATAPILLHSTSSSRLAHHRRAAGHSAWHRDSQGWDEDDSIWSTSQSALATSDPESFALICAGSEGEALPALSQPSQPQLCPPPPQPSLQHQPECVSQCHPLTLSAPLSIPVPKARSRLINQQRRQMTSVSLPVPVPSRQGSSGCQVRRLQQRRISLSSRPHEAQNARHQLPLSPQLPPTQQQKPRQPHTQPQPSQMHVQKQQQKKWLSSLTQQLRDQAQHHPNQAEQQQQHLQHPQQESPSCQQDTSADDCAKLDTLQRVSPARKGNSQGCGAEARGSPGGMSSNHNELSSVNRCSIVFE